MDILELEKNQFTVAVMGEKVGEDFMSPVLEFLRDQPPQYAASADGFKSLFEQYSLYGRKGLTASQFHEANNQEDIWEFIKGDIRIYCFRDPERKSLVLLSNGVLKKTQAARRKDIKIAVRARDAYLQAVGQKTVQFYSADELRS